jgi:arsenite-transporting ATPase
MQGNDPLSSLPAVDWTSWRTPFLFFTGKGGVGKTTVASSAALALAEGGGSEGGERVLVVSTDPASNLGDVFGVEAHAEPTQVPGVEGLYVSNLDPEEAAEAYKERVVGPYRGVLPRSAVASMEEQLSGACTVEIAAFNEFTALLTDEDTSVRFDRVIFDTAPTGHTLRLLSLPGAWSGYVETHPEGASCLGPLAGLEAQRERYAAAVERLADGTETTVVLVSRPEESALVEAARAGSELGELGITNQTLIVNGVFASDPGEDPVATAIRERQRRALDGLPESLRKVDTATVPMVPGDLTGLDALRGLSSGEAGSSGATASRVVADSWGPGIAEADAAGISGLVDELERAGRGVVMTMGKGGVGKTTVAAALAVSLSERGQRVVLSTTDPAAHLEGTLGAYRPEGLTVERIDPEKETARYAEEVLAASGELDEEGRSLLEEDLRSPCTEEIAVFRAFARTVDEAEDAIVVLDTAPTGHTLLLLDAAQSYHREVQRTTGEVPPEVGSLLPRLKDPSFARVLVVTLAESTPVDEAARLQEDLRRAGIEPYGWVVNSSLAASGSHHPLLASRARLEQPYLAKIGELSGRRWVVPWQASAVGREGLMALTGALAGKG